MKDKNSYDSIRVAVVSALAAISVGLLAVLHDSEKLFGFFVAESGFVWQVYNFTIILLFFEIILCIVFLLSTGFVYSFKDGEHLIMKWVQKIVYSWLVAIFPLSFISIMYNIAVRVFGFDAWIVIDILMLLALFVLIVLLIIVLIIIIRMECIRNKDRH